MRSALMALVVALAAVLTAASPAAAARMIATFDGMVVSTRAGVEFHGECCFAGKSFSLTYRYDTDEIAEFTLPDGYNYKMLSDLHGVLTVGAFKYAFQTPALNFDFTQYTGDPPFISATIYTGDDEVLYINDAQPLGPVPTATQTGHVALGTDISTFEFAGFNPCCNILQREVWRIDMTDFTVSTAPEPSSWLVLILGFGAAGACLRRRASADRLARTAC